MLRQSQRVLVTGADGFIGSHLVERLLDEGYEVRALVQYNSIGNWGWLEEIDLKRRKEIDVVLADLRDPFSMRKVISGCQRVFHLGALIAIPYSYIAPKEYIDTNILGTLNVMQACLEEKVQQVIHTSTSEVYGTAQYVPIDEKHPLQGQSPYSASKIGADKIAESYYLSFSLPVTTIRPFNTYGPRQSARAIIPTIISQALSEDVIKLGSLDPVRDLNYVGDTVDGFVRAATSPESVGQVINVGNGLGINMGDLAKLILKIMKIDKAIVEDQKRLRPQKSEVFRLISDNKKAEALLKWRPSVSLEEGLRRTITWLEKNISGYKTNIYNT